MNYRDNVHTGLFSNRALMILKAAVDSACSKAQYRKRRVLDAIGKPERAPNNEIVFKTGGDKSENEFKWCGLAEMNETQVRKFVAKCMKDLITWLWRHHYNLTWARDSQDKMPITFERFNADLRDVKVHEYYFVYDVMSGRDVRKKYPESLTAELRGVENDQVITSMNECADREVEKLVAEFKNTDNDITQAFNNSYNDIFRKRNDARAVNRKNLREKIRVLMDKFGTRPLMTKTLDELC